MTEVQPKLTRRTVPVTRPVWQRSSRSAWLLSWLLHASIFVALALLWTSGPPGTTSERGGPVGIAVVQDFSGSETYFLSSDPVLSNQPQLRDAIASLPTAELASADQARALGELLPGVDAVGDTSASGDLGLAAGGAVLPQGGRPAAVKTQLFGIEGEGSRFIYVFDRSDSMNGYEGKPLRRAKSELLGSLDSLGPTHQFQIIFYNDTPLPYGGFSARGPELLRGDPTTKQLAGRFVSEMTAVGGTNHVDARNGLGHGTRRGFLLDRRGLSRPSSRPVGDYSCPRRRLGTALHCIHFGEGNPTTRSGWISRLAEASGGQYRYVDVASF